jgi:hypothetical protein
VIRLWNRVGIFRALSAVLLLVSVVGGLMLSDRQSQHYRTLTAMNLTSADRLDMVQVDDDTAQLQRAHDLAERAEALAAQRDAQAKADAAAKLAAAQAEKAQDEARRADAANRSKDRTATASPSAKSTTKVGPTPPDCASYSGNRAIGCTMVLAAGLSLDQMVCLEKLFTRESGWSTSASNPSGAYGIPQAKPGSKMASAGADWKTSAATQIAWGLDYIKSRYGTPCSAWGHSQSTGWY